jgi:hypothetical protein
MSDVQIYAVIAIVCFIGGVFFALLMGWIESGDEDER